MEENRQNNLSILSFYNPGAALAVTQYDIPGVRDLINDTLRRPVSVEVKQALLNDIILAAVLNNRVDIIQYALSDRNFSDEQKIKAILFTLDLSARTVDIEIFKYLVDLAHQILPTLKLNFDFYISGAQYYRRFDIVNYLERLRSLNESSQF